MKQRHIRQTLVASAATLTLVGGIVAAIPMARAQQSPPSLKNLSVFSDTKASEQTKLDALRADLQQIVDNNESQFIITGVQFKDLQTGQSLYSYNPDMAQYAASLNKVPLGWLLLQDLRNGRVQMSQQLSWTASQVVPGYGYYDQTGAPTTATVQQLIWDMFNRSGNTATEVLGNQTLGGPLAMNGRLAQYPQLVQTSFQGVTSSSGYLGFYLGNTTPNEGSWLMEQLQGNKDGYEHFMQAALANNIFTNYGVRSQLSGNPNIELANKVGIIDDADAGSNRCDEGIIYNFQTHRSYEYSFMTTNFSADLSSNRPAEQSLEQMGLVILRFAGDKQQSGAPINQSTPQTPAFHESPQLDKKVLY
ncbi:MAG TPA: serine hydrolase [Candidatus Saccharimonadales bacterium]|nr:serine hydrolase [Candidatus Saccharimonadales bacterium]